MSDHNTFINKIIKLKNKTVQWNDTNLTRLIAPGTEHHGYITNQDGTHGYFWYLHKLTEHVDGTVVELGNRRGCSTLAIYDALKEGQSFYSFDIENDCRYITPEVWDDSRVVIENDFDSLDAERIERTFEKNSIAMLFADTIHTFEQIKAEYDLWKPYMKDDCILVVDDIVSDYDSSDPRTKGQFHDEWTGIKFDVTSTAHQSGFGIYL